MKEEHIKERPFKTYSRTWRRINSEKKHYLKIRKACRKEIGMKYRKKRGGGEKGKRNI